MRNEIFEGFEPIDYVSVVEQAKNTQNIVFECFNGTVGAIELETHLKEGIKEIGGRPLSFGAMRTLKLVNDYDTFINESDFNLQIEAVGRLEMEHFWRVIALNNSYKVVNKATTYGNSSIWQIAKGKHTIGFLLNNMTFDGQNSYYLWSLREKTVNGQVFSNKGFTNELFFKILKYPSCKSINGKYASRFGKSANITMSNGETAIGAWSILETKDSIAFYGEMKKHDWLTRQDKQLLKLARKSKGGASFDCYIESLEEELEQISSDIQGLSYCEAYELLIRKQEIENKLIELSEEDNSLNPESKVEDMFYY